ncbi:putative pyruvate/Phosphoenolpyruvate kinase-like domain superfamily [Helianthus annuus]|nr:putative pyruvate/Phosphoenolpyruvate kinase-like domain superfamily [Helianthus annuus]
MNHVIGPIIYNPINRLTSPTQTPQHESFLSVCNHRSLPSPPVKSVTNSTVPTLHNTSINSNLTSKTSACDNILRSRRSVRYTSMITASYGGDRAENDGVLEPSPAEKLRKLLDSPGVHQGPACFNALSAKLVERAGFQFCFTTV